MVDTVLEAESITIGNVKIQDATNSNNVAHVNSSGHLALQNPSFQFDSSGNLKTTGGGGGAGGSVTIKDGPVVT
jgi:hypothetical protein